MISLLLLSYALAAEPAPVTTAPPTGTPIEWVKPLAPGVDPSKATLVVFALDDTDESDLKAEVMKWNPDAVLAVHTDFAGKRELLAAASMARGTNIARVQVYIDQRGVSGDRDDPKIVPRGVDPDDHTKTLRVADFMEALAGSQQSIGIIAWGAISADLSSKGTALVGADADLWVDAMPDGMNGWAIAANDVNTPPKGCGATFGRLLAQGYGSLYRTGKDLTVDAAMNAAKRQAELISSCGYAPEWAPTGAASLDDVLFKGTGVGPAVANTTTVTSTNPLPVDPLPQSPKVPRKRTVPLPVSIGAAGAGAALMGFAGVLALGIEADAQSESSRFAEPNVRKEFSSEEAARAEAERLNGEFRARGNVVTGLVIGGGALVIGGGVTVLVSDQGGILGFTGRW